MKKTIIILGMIIFIIPLLLIGYISYREMEEYKPEVEYIIEEKSYGAPVEITRRSIDEGFSLTGTFTSNTYVFIDTKNKDSEIVRTFFSPEDEVKTGDILALIGYTEVISEHNGIIKEMNIYGNEGYVKLLDLDSLVFECYIPVARNLTVGSTYSVEGGGSMELISLSNIADSAGRKAVFTMTGVNGLYGETKTVKVLTGFTYNNVLVVRSNCVYQKQVGGPYFIRRVDASGLVIGEFEVQIGITDGYYYTVTGAEEGWFCDSGYAQFVNLQAD